ncbi:MAG: DUF4338 domain-containing protein [Acidobacteriota bacterium]|nr:DUF4338 domain-containing protein [Acidobacteriota bacterium]
MNKPIATIRKRVIYHTDIELINNLLSEEGYLGRSHLSRRLCKIWEWRQKNGSYKEITCRDLLRRLDSKGYIKLPPMMRPARRKGYKNKTKIPVELDTSELSLQLKTIKNNIDIKQVRGTSDEKLFNGLIGKYHYIGYFQGAGKQLKYIVFLDKRPIACIGFGASALKVECRDKFIGWNSAVRINNLNIVVDNSRFLILPWIKIPHLASYILGRTLRNLSADWVKYHCHRIVLVETFVDTERFKGICYKAANWQFLGLTKGRGRNDRYRNTEKSVKAVFVRSLCKDFRELCNE